VRVSARQRLLEPTLGDEGAEQVSDFAHRPWLDDKPAVDH
jgi:hypothetical protein